MIEVPKLNEVIEEIRSFQIGINDTETVRLEVDGLCENPGAMHIGVFASQGSNCLFARHLFVGHGTCNEAEYIAVKTGLQILQALYPDIKVPVVVQSDSRLVVKQVNGEWVARDKMRAYCIFLCRLRKTFPFELRKVPRSENTMADGLAQKYILKNSGRTMALENGRFHVSKQVPATVKTTDTFMTLTNSAFREYLAENNLHYEISRVLDLCQTGQTQEALAHIQRVMQQAEKVLMGAPKSNDLVVQWVTNTVELIRQTLVPLLNAVQERDIPTIQYYIDEMSGSRTDSSGEGFFEVQMATEASTPTLEEYVESIEEEFLD